MKPQLNAIVRMMVFGLLLSATTVFAQSKPDATGTWKWSMPGRDGAPARETTLKLKQDGEKLTGSVSGRMGETEISEGSVKGDQVAFKVTREFNGNSFTQSYKGKLAGDTITGTMEMARDGETNSRPWEAKREGAAAAAAKGADPTGTWVWTTPGFNGGPDRQTTLTLKMADGKLTGSLTGFRGALTSISDATVKGDQVTFKVVRERNGQTMTSKYSAKLSSETLKGTIEMERNGEPVSREWEAKRVKTSAAGVTGTWKWTMDMNGNSIERSIKLVQDGNKLTGTSPMMDSEAPIENGKVENGQISFEIKREFNGNQLVIKHSAKVEGDKLTGKIEFTMGDGGEPRSMDWNAERAK